MSKERLFSFNTPEHSDYHLEVVSFVGSEMIGELYGYEIELISTKEDIDFDAMLHADVSLQLHNKESDDIYIHGILASFEAHQKIGEYIYYKAYLVPKLWRLSIAQHQEIFLNQSITDIMESILRDAQFTSSDYELRLQGEYEPREYVCMYKESRYDFLRRWMEREGLYFYFEQTQQQCKLIITDAKSIHQSLPDMDKIPYKPASGLQQFSDHAVSSLIYRSNTTINSVKMKNYDYNKPSLDISATSQDSNQAYSETYLFGNNLSSIAEAQKLSSINEEKYKALSSEMSGESNIPALTPGYIYRLQEYFKESLNGDYLMLRVESSGSQRGFLSTGFTQDGDDSSYYSNTFMMIPSQRQYRMQSQTPWPHIGGMISATIDAQGSGETAELDKYGRYKVIMPFDISGRKDAKASAYLRMAQPSAGAKQGFHFPLHKGTEVLIAFKGGDPDQPIITAAVPNVETPSPVNEDNVTKNVIQTHGGNIIHMEDTPGEAHIKLAVHDDLSSIVIHNEPDEPEKGWNKENYEAGEGGIAYYSKGPFKFLSGSWDNTVGGLKEDF
ncbi:MAG: type VI secretion system tip protein TssI/VgrG, partial [Campylobacterota bacterium]|nr:type VI secretion system tip protein TssI/VgrG [Campylobacterota bacterium]